MKVVNLDTGATQIRTAHEDLLRAWDDLRDAWHDAASERFFQEHLEPIGPKVKNGLDAIERMGLLLEDVANKLSE